MISKQELKLATLTRYLTVLALAVLMPCRSSVAQVDAEKRSTALVQVRINTAYDDSTESLSLLNALIEHGPTRQVAVPAGGTLSSICVREYAFGFSDLPKTYQLIVAAILARNKLGSPEDLKPGFLVIPAIPRRAATIFNKSDFRNYVADRYIFRVKDALPAEIASACSHCKPSLSAPGINSIAEIGNAADIAYTGPTGANGNRIAAQYTLVNYELPLAATADFMASGPVAAVSSVFAYPLPISLAADYTCDLADTSKDIEFLKDSEKQQITDLLGNSQRSSFFFVLDTGWPSQATYDQSRNDLYSILTTIWKHYFNIEFSSAKASPSIGDPNHPHCKCIERSLRSLRALDAAHHVKVIYLPLTQEQGGATIIADLLQTMVLLQQVSDANVTLTPDIVKKARDQAEELATTRFPQKWVGESVRTDKSLLDAVLFIGNKYSETQKTVFIANESWTAIHEQYFVTYPSPLFGTVVAATGNADENVNEKALDFSQRASNNHDTIAVLNMQAKGIICDSGFIDQRDIDSAMAVGFDGHITEDFCATSFATPRVAWFLAAGEAVRTADLTPRHWGIDLHDCLSALRNGSNEGFTKLLFEPVKFLVAESKGTCKSPPATPM
jgi:hypothetical protein